MLLCFVIFAVVGCGGSSNHSVSQNPSNQEITDENDELDVGISGDVPAKANDDPEILRILDKIFALDEDGVPAIFNYAPLPENYDNAKSVNGTPINFSQYVFSSDLNENGEFVKTFALEKDNDYIIKYSRVGRTLNGSYLQFKITAPEDQVMILDLIGTGKSSSDEELENRGIVSKSIYVPTEKEVIPEEAPCIMLYSFKAPVTGNYEFAIKEAYTFNLISDDIDEIEYYDLPFEFRLYTPSEVRREVSEQSYAVVSDAKENNNSDVEKIIIAPRIDNVPYDSQYAPGAGFYAHSGLRSIQLTALYDDLFSDNAIDDFTIKKPQGDFTIKSNIDVDFISTEKKFLTLSKVNELGDFSLLKDALSNKMRKSARLGLAGSKTLSIRYERYESAPRMPAMEDIRVRSAVVKQLKNDFNTFQREHGDYFVAGYTFGLFYDALVEIKAEPYDCYYTDPDDGRTYYDAEEIAENVGNYIGSAFLKAKVHDSNKIPYDMISKVATALKDARGVSISISDVNHSGTVKNANISSLSDLMQDFYDFKQKAIQTPSSEFERLYATLIRYREIENVKKIIPEELPIKAEHYKLIRDLNKIIYLTRCYKNAIDSIPAAHLINGESKRQEWDNEFSGVFNLYNNQLNRLCSDINFVREYYDKFSSLLEKYKGLNYRYVFYRHMVSCQKGVRKGVGDWKNSDDGKDDKQWLYPYFRAGFDANDIANNKFIKEDLSEGSQYSSGWYVNADKWTSLSDSEKERKGSFPADTRVYYYEGGPIDTNKSEATDLRGHSLGKTSFHWKFDRGGFRRVEIKVDFKLINMPASKYPFVGLED